MSPIITVTSAATSRKLIEASYARDMLNLSVTDISDQKLDNLIDGISAMVERWCNRKLIQETVSEQWRLRQCEENIWLTRWPVTLVTSITEDDDDPLTSTYWEIDYDTGRLARLDGSDNPIYWEPLKIVIVYRAGYVAADETGTTIPDDLRDGALAILRSAWYVIDRDPFEKSIEIPGLATIAYGFGPMARSGASSIPPDAEALLAPYRQPAVG